MADFLGVGERIFRIYGKALENCKYDVSGGKGYKDYKVKLKKHLRKK